MVRSSVSQSERQAGRIEKSAGIVPKPHDLEAAARALVRWAGNDSDRLALAGEALLDAPTKDSKRIEGFSLASLELAWRSLRASGVPSSKWLQTASTRRTVAVYNTALDRFVSLQANELARGISEQDFGLHSV